MEAKKKDTNFDKFDGVLSPVRMDNKALEILEIKAKNEGMTRSAYVRKQLYRIAKAERE